MKSLLRILIVCALFGCSSPAGSTHARKLPGSPTLSATPPPVTVSVSVLFIGNSYTSANDLPTMFAELARSGGDDVQVGIAAQGGWRLSDHVQSPETLEELRSARWSFIVLQEQSQIPALETYRTQEMYPAARELVSVIRERGATPIFFLTWAHRDGWPERGIIGYESMQNQIDTGYQGIAEELNVTVAPVGSAWRTALQQYPESDLWREDGSHPSEQGSYLAACVLYAVIFQQSPLGLPYHANLPADTAETLESIAAETVLVRR